MWCFRRKPGDDGNDVFSGRDRVMTGKEDILRDGIGASWAFMGRNSFAYGLNLVASRGDNHVISTV